jgi:hypothetical protein
MASSHPTAQSEHLFAATTDETTISQYVPSAYAYPQQGDSQPPSPNGISAAAILATMSDSRPPTSHAEVVDDLDEEDTETGGISLADEWEGMNVTATAPTITHYPGFFAPPEPVWAWMPSHGVPNFSYASLEDHAAALEALTMDSHPPPAAMPSPLPETFVAPPPNSTHLQDFAPSAYEEHLSIQDTSAFTDITSFFHYYAAPPKMVTRALDFETQPDTIRREDLDGEKCDYQGIDWSERAGRDLVRTKRVAFETARLPHKAWQKIVGVDKQVSDCTAKCCVLGLIPISRRDHQNNTDFL